MAKITNNPVIELDNSEITAVIIDGLRRKYGKKIVPADLSPEAVQIRFGEVNGTVWRDLDNAKITISTPVEDAPAESQSEGA